MAVFDVDAFARLAAVTPDGLEVRDRQYVIALLNPGGRDFGSDVDDLVAACVAERVLRLRDPVRRVFIQPTLVNEYRDGGFLVLVEVAAGVTLASPQIPPRRFDDHGVPLCARVMTDVVDQIRHLVAAFDAARSTR